jgi:hypothetical protein
MVSVTHPRHDAIPSKCFSFSRVFSICVLRHGGMAETVGNEGTEEVTGLVLFQYFLFYFQAS